MEASHRRVARRTPIVVLIVAGITAFAVAAWADTINFTGQGTTNGACNTLNQGSVPAGQQIWQFNLTQTQAGATITASFSDGTNVVNQAESQHQGNTSFFFIQTDLGATLISATATFTPSGENSQFTVSHCTVPSTTTPTTGATTTTAPNGTTTTAPNGTTTTGANGTTTTTGAIGTTTTAPTGTSGGTTPTSAVGGASVTATIAVAPTVAGAQARRLAFTGSPDMTVVFLWGLGLVLLGTALAIVARRHRVPPTEQ